MITYIIRNGIFVVLVWVAGTYQDDLTRLALLIWLGWLIVSPLSIIGIVHKCKPVTISEIESSVGVSYTTDVVFDISCIALMLYFGLLVEAWMYCVHVVLLGNIVGYLRGREANYKE